jgi:hypothetical protein
MAFFIMHCATNMHILNKTPKIIFTTNLFVLYEVIVIPIHILS